MNTVSQLKIEELKKNLSLFNIACQTGIPLKSIKEWI